MIRRAIAILASQLLIAGAALGQEPGVGAIRGTVVGLFPNEPGRSVLVLLDNGLSTYAGEDGRFSLLSVPAGSRRIAAITSRCDVALGEFEMARGVELTVQLHLPPPKETTAAPEPAGRSETRSSGVAVGVLTAADIGRMRVSSVEEAIRRVAPRMLMTTGADYGRGMHVEGARGATTVVGSNVPLIVVDGVRLDESMTMSLHSINVDEVERIEIVRGATGGWAYGQGGANGVIRIYTRGSSRPHDAWVDPEVCGFSFSN